MDRRRRPRRIAPGEARIAIITGLDDGVFVGRPSLTFSFLGPARLVGYLQSQGIRDVTNHDLTIGLERWQLETGKTLDFSIFSDPLAVDEYLNDRNDDPHSAYAELVDLLLDMAHTTDADLYGLSLVRQWADARCSDVAMAVNLSLIHGLKRRHPNCVTVLGGLNYVLLELVRESQVQLLRRCPALDFVVEGPGEAALYNIVRAAFEERTLDELGQAYHREGHQYLLCPTTDDCARAVGLANPKPNKADIRLPGDYSLSAYYSLPSASPVFTNASDNQRSGHELIDLRTFEPELRKEVEPHLDRQILPLTLQFMKGCSGVCSFCAAANIQPRALPVGEVVRQILEMKERHGTSSFIFLNNALNWSYRYAHDFADELIRTDARILWTDSLTLHALDEPLLAKLRESGFIRADIGVEVASSRMRTAMRKPLTTQGVVDRLRLLHDHGIWCDINMIVGFPREEREDIDATRRFLEEASDYYMKCTFNLFSFVDTSPIGHSPEAFDVVVRPGRAMTPVGWRRAFDEVGGMTFEKRVEWTEKVEQELRSLVNSLGPVPFADRFNAVPFHLVFLLYQVFGHERFSNIRRVLADLLRGPQTGRANDGRSTQDERTRRAD
jgi:radical SAM superfamily enzyme YgiQ (UPF0313 family)